MVHVLTNYGPSLGFQSNQEQEEYILAAIAHLEALTGRKLEIDPRNPRNPSSQLNIWMGKLKKYPRWKVSELGDYAGPMNYKVFEYLDSLHRIEDPYSELGYAKDRKLLAEEPESQANQRTQIARDFAAHVAKWCGGVGVDGEYDKQELSTEERKKRRIGEWESYKFLDKKYPHLNVLSQVRKEKRFQGLT